MLSLARIFSLLLLVVAIVSAQELDNELLNRADASASATNSLTSKGGDSISSSLPTTSPAQTSAITSAAQTSSTPTSISSTPTPTSQSTSETSTSQQESSSTTSPDTSTTTSPSPTTTTPPTQSGSVVMVTTSVTENGIIVASTFSSTSTGSPQSTSLADNGSSNGSGISSSTKAIIGGVVGGVGGAIVLAVLFAVIWRVRKNRRTRAEDNDDVLMMGQAYSAHGEKESTGAGSSPFKSTLESYHNPNNAVNASSNF